MVLAGLRRSTGLVVAYEVSDLKNYIRRYLNWGEYLFDKLSQMAENSQYFRKENPLDGFIDSVFKKYQRFIGDPKKPKSQDYNGDAITDLLRINASGSV